MGVAVADYNNDGNEDLFVVGVHANFLYRNNGDGTFTDVTKQAGLTGPGSLGRAAWSVGACWIDYDNDGLLDLFISNYCDWQAGSDPICGGMADQARTIRLPVHLVEQVNKLARIKRDMHQRLGREATHEELAEESGLPAEKIADLLDHARDPVSLDMPVGAEEEAPLGDFIEDGEAADAETTVISRLLHDDLRRVLATLEDREQHVIRLRYGLDDGQPRTLDQIGRRFGLSRERVRQIERETMAKLRIGERADRLRSYAS